LMKPVASRNPRGWEEECGVETAVRRQNSKDLQQFQSKTG
jgi:hypothetical protein